ncbi:MAG: GntR family transcriptional regulator [Salinarimonadaceae bacterium]|nr:MAG: GntR family transcriptional regulator [Salinarimonadaceae bacterium]
MSRAQHIYESLIEALRNGTYAPGDRIRAEDVARLFDVSRTPVREALSRLQERGLLEMTATGLAVARLGRQGVHELYALRELLEGAAARFAAQHASPSDVQAMRQISDAFEATQGNPARAAQINRAFHDALYEAAHNRFLTVSLAGLHDTLMLLPSTTFAVDGRQDKAVVEHRAILAAIEARDPDSADAHAREHIRSARDARLSMMFEY